MRPRAYLLDSEWFHSIPVHPGDMMILWQSIPHFGVRNNSTLLPRIGLFSILSSDDSDDQDEYQYFRWMYIADAYGNDSRQYAEALVQGKQHDPLKRMDGQSYRRARETLKKYRLFTAYYS